MTRLCVGVDTRDFVFSRTNLMIAGFDGSGNAYLFAFSINNKIWGRQMHDFMQQNPVCTSFQLSNRMK